MGPRVYVNYIVHSCEWSKQPHSKTNACLFCLCGAGKLVRSALSLALCPQHVQSFNHQWGKPGGGAPRVNHAGQVDATPKNLTSLLEAHVHTGWNFRRT